MGKAVTSGATLELDASVSTAATCRPDADSFRVLLDAADHVRDLSASAVVDLMAGLERHSSALMAVQMQVLADLARPGRAGNGDLLAEQLTGRKTLTVMTEELVAELAEAAERLTIAEVAARLNIAHVTARKKLELALSFTGDSRRGLFDRLREGVLDRGRLRTIDDELEGLTPAQQAHIDDVVADRLEGKTNAQIRMMIRRQIILMDPEAAEKKAEEAVKGRTVMVHPAADNMASFNALLPADVAVRAFTLLDRCSPRSGPNDERCVDQRRADTFDNVFSSLLADGIVTVDQLLGNTPHQSGHGKVAAVPGTAPTLVPVGGTLSPSVDGAPSPSEGGSTPIVGASAPSSQGDPAVRPDGARSMPQPTPEPASGNRRTLRKQGREVTLHVHLSLATLLGLDNNPGTLDGYGTITAGYSRALAESATSLRAVLTDPASGNSIIAGNAARVRHGFERAPTGSRAAPRKPDTPVTMAIVSRIDRRSHLPGAKPGPDSGFNSGFGSTSGSGGYRPSQRLRDDVTAVWTHCTFPRCRQPSWRTDLDHRQAYDHHHPEDGGATSADNLQPLCRAHHRIKTFTDWDCTITADGTIHWTSPTGHHYPVHPEPYIAPDEWTTTQHSPPRSPHIYPWIAPTSPEQLPTSMTATATSTSASASGYPTGQATALRGSSQTRAADTPSSTANGWPEEPTF